MDELGELKNRQGANNENENKKQFQNVSQPESH